MQVHKVDNDTLKMYLSFGEEIEARHIPRYLLRDWEDCTIDGRSLLSIREFQVLDCGNKEPIVYQYYVTPIIYSLMTGQYELTRRLLEKGCGPFFWQKNYYQIYKEKETDKSSHRIEIQLPCYLLLNSTIPKDLRYLLWEHIDKEVQERDRVEFLNIAQARFSVAAFGICLVSDKFSPEMENLFIHNIEDLIKNHPRLAYKLEDGLFRLNMSYINRMRLQKMLTKLYHNDVGKLSRLFYLFQLDEDDVSGKQKCTLRGETLKEYCKKYDGVDFILEHWKYIGQFYQSNLTLRQYYFENLVVNLAWLQEVASSGECKTIDAFAKQYYEPTCSVDSVSLHCLESDSFEFLQRTNLYRKCAGQLLDFKVDGEIGRDYIKYAVDIIGYGEGSAQYRNGATGEQMLKQWLCNFDTITYKNPFMLPFSMDRLFECKDRELIVLAIKKGLLPKERCEEYIAYCMEEHYMEYIPFLLYLRSELYFSEGAG